MSYNISCAIGNMDGQLHISISTVSYDLSVNRTQDFNDPGHAGLLVCNNFFYLQD